MSPANMAKLEASMRAALDFYDAFNRHDVDAIVGKTSVDCQFEPALGEPVVGKEDITRYWQGFFEREPLARLEIDEVFSLGERCVMRWRLNSAGTVIRGVDVFRVRDGLVCEQLSYQKQ